MSKKGQVVIDRFRLFLGKPVPFGENGIGLYSPTINEIVEMGDSEYSINLLLCSFDAKNIMKLLFSFSDEQLEEMQDIDDYDFFVDIIKQDHTGSGVRNGFCKAISCFVKEVVEFDVVLNVFRCKSGIVVDKSNYREFGNTIVAINGGETKKKKKEKEMKFLNKSLERAYKAMQKQKEDAERKDREKNGLELKDILSILCNADGNGISVFNVGDLSIYQVYEHFERMNLKEMYLRVLPVWANGYWDGKKNEFPEWIKKTKM